MNTDNRVCITIKQPFAWLIIRPDVTAAERAELARLDLLKTVENRSWKTSYTGWLYIHAGKEIDAKAYSGIQTVFAPRIIMPPMQELQTGGIIGRVKLVDCVLDHGSVWTIPGNYYWLLHEAEPLPFEPMRGQQGLWKAGNSKRA